MSSPHNGRIVGAVTWFLLVTSTLAIFTRLLSKRALQRKWDIDDGLAVSSLVSAESLHAEDCFDDDAFTAVRYRRRHSSLCASCQWFGNDYGHTKFISTGALRQSQTHIIQ